MTTPLDEVPTSELREAIKRRSAAAILTACFFDNGGGNDTRTYQHGDKHTLIGYAQVAREMITIQLIGEATEPEGD